MPVSRRINIGPGGPGVSPVLPGTRPEGAKGTLTRRPACDEDAVKPGGKSGPCVVIIGGGFAGLSALNALASAPVAVTLVDRNVYSTFQPLLYQVATAGLTAADVAYPLWW